LPRLCTSAIISISDANQRQRVRHRARGRSSDACHGHVDSANAQGKRRIREVVGTPTITFRFFHLRRPYLHHSVASGSHPKKNRAVLERLSSKKGLWGARQHRSHPAIFRPNDWSDRIPAASTAAFATAVVPRNARRQLRRLVLAQTITSPAPRMNQESRPPAASAIFWQSSPKTHESSRISPLANELLDGLSAPN